MGNSHSGDGLTIVFESLSSDPGLDVVDPIERRRRPIHTPESVAPSSVDQDAFRFPVTASVAIETEALSITDGLPLIVRDEAGQMIEEVTQGETRTFPAGEYSLEPSGIVKVYVRVESPLRIDSDTHQVDIGLDGTRRVLIGSRSTHDRPAATVTTTPDPEDLLAAISTFGSALKTTTPERAFPLHRGHPPRLEVGPECSIPAGLEPPANDLHIEVPPTYRHAYAAAPLAYYLGARIEPGPEPRIVGQGIDHVLDAMGPVEDGVERALKQVFLLDCVTRTEGLFRVDLHERRVLEDRLDVDFVDLYNAPHHERVARYLDVPHEVVADQVPTWGLTAHVESSIDSAETLPYLVDDLAVVRRAEAERVSAEAIETGAATGLMRSASPSTTRGESTLDTSFVHPCHEADSIEQAWVGEGTPLGATKAVTAAYENRIGRTPSTGSIDISVVCNADAMAEEGDAVDDVYGSGSSLPFDVNVHRNLSREELVDLLAREHDFLHYVGHIGDDGFRCSDGRLDIANLEDVGVDAFFLNACQSYEQGTKLIQAGAIGGIVTVRDVVNHGAVRIGSAVARLLNCGFPLRPAIEIARDESVIGSLYAVVGDGGFSVVQPESGAPFVQHISRTDEGFAVEFDMFGGPPGMGCLYYPYCGSRKQYHLASGYIEEFSVSEDDFIQHLNMDEYPLRVECALEWSSEVTPTDF